MGRKRARLPPQLSAAVLAFWGGPPAGEPGSVIDSKRRRLYDAAHKVPTFRRTSEQMVARRTFTHQQLAKAFEVAANTFERGCSSLQANGEAIDGRLLNRRKCFLNTFLCYRPPANGLQDLNKWRDDFSKSDASASQPFNYALHAGFSPAQLTNISLASIDNYCKRVGSHFFLSDALDAKYSAILYANIFSNASP
jgi:hypothetical protein